MLKDRDDLEPAVKAAAVSLGFVGIHPFADGNGRLGIHPPQYIYHPSQYICTTLNT